ncbi:hypothetical protein FPQ18DRAFT_308240 [Pyronema domesticum]|nr:hypothetical protein FPQ18DRAFT_308240 [Pyronema domesticum]
MGNVDHRDMIYFLMRRKGIKLYGQVPPYTVDFEAVLPNDTAVRKRHTGLTAVILKHYDDTSSGRNGVYGSSIRDETRDDDDDEDDDDDDDSDDRRRRPSPPPPLLYHHHHHHHYHHHHYHQLSNTAIHHYDHYSTTNSSTNTPSTTAKNHTALLIHHRIDKLDHHHSSAPPLPRTPPSPLHVTQNLRRNRVHPASTSDTTATTTTISTISSKPNYQTHITESGSTAHKAASFLVASI